MSVARDQQDEDVADGIIPHVPSHASHHEQEPHKEEMDLLNALSNVMMNFQHSDSTTAWVLLIQHTQIKQNSELEWYFGGEEVERIRKNQ